MKALKPLASLFHYFQSTLYRKILFSFFLIIVLTVSLLIGDFYVRTASDLKEQSVNNMKRLTQQSSATLNSYMSNTKAFSWNYFGDTAFQDFVLHMGKDPDAISYYQNKFIQFKNDNPIISAVNVIQLNGFSTRVGTSLIDNSPKEKNRLIAIATEANGKGVWVQSQVQTTTKTTVLTLTYVQAIRRITLSSPGPIIGVMMYEMSPNVLKQWFQDVKGGGANETYIVEEESGDIIYALEPEEGEGVELSSGELAGIEQAKASGQFYTKEHADSSLVVYVELTGTDWLLLSKYPTKELLKPVNEFTKRTIVIGALIMLLAMLLASFLSSRTITPLKELSKGMKAIEVGNYDIHLPIRSKDEIGYLSSSFNRMAREINRLIMKVYETELVKKNAEIKALQSQINPHFLYNTLGIIDSLSVTSGDSRVSQISRSLAKMFRYNISGDDISTLEAEMQQIRLYLSIQKIRFDARLDFSLYLEPGLESVALPKLLFQPLVENSVNHGIGPCIEGGIVRVEAVTDDAGDIEVRVWNNGAPIPEERQQWLNELLKSASKFGEQKLEAASIGLSNVQSRIQMVYGSGYGVSLENSSSQGTAFVIRISRTLASRAEGILA